MNKPPKINQIVCPKCKAIMDPIWENNGYTPPEGPSHWEIMGYQCPDCKHKED